MNSFVAEPLAWDSQFLGFPVARLRAVQGSGSGLAELIAECRAAGTKLLYISLAPDDDATAAVVRQAGGWLADRKLTYQLSLKEAQSARLPATDITISLATAYSAQLENLAWQSGEFSRFRLDRNFAPNVFKDLYSQWLRKALAGYPHQEVLVAYAAAPAATGLLVLGFQHQQAAIEIVAVEAAYRGQGVGQQLLQTACRHAHRQGCTTLQVVTQRANHRACRFYEQFGFQLVEEVALYHLWL